MFFSGGFCDVLNFQFKVMFSQVKVMLQAVMLSLPIKTCEANITTK
jgi:hypothetical protein